MYVGGHGQTWTWSVGRCNDKTRESEHHTAWNMSMMDASTDTVDGFTALYDE